MRTVRIRNEPIINAPIEYVRKRNCSLRIAQATNMNLNRENQKLKRMQHQCDVISKLKQQLSDLQHKYDDLSNKYDMLLKEHKEYKSKYQHNHSLQHQLEQILEHFEADKLSGKLYHRLMRSVIHKLRESDIII